MFFRVDKRIKAESQISVAVYVQILRHSSKNNAGVLYSSSTQEQLADYLDVRQPTISNSDYLDLLTKLDIKVTPIQYNKHTRYIYELNLDAERYFSVNDHFIDRVKELGYKLWSFILKLRACSNDHKVMGDDADLYEEINLSRNTFNKYIKQAIDLNLIQKIDGGYFIDCLTNKSEYLAALEDYCEENNCKYIHSKCEEQYLTLIKGKLALYKVKYDLEADCITLFKAMLSQKFKKLPSSASTRYFTSSLLKMSRKKQSKLDEIIL